MGGQSRVGGKRGRAKRERESKIHMGRYGGGSSDKEQRCEVR